MKKKFSLLAICCGLLFLKNVSADEIEQNDGYSFLKECLQTDQRAQPFPTQVMYESQLVEYLWFSHFANTFPFGVDQPNYVRQQKLKKIAFGTFEIGFDANGRVNRFGTISIDYKNDFPVKIGPYSFDPKTGVFPTSTATFKFDEHCSLVEYSGGKGSDYWIKFRNASNGAAREIEESQEDAVGPFGSAHIVSKSVIYRTNPLQPNAYPSRADPVDITITNSYYLNFIQPFIFESDGTKFSERRIVKSGYIGRGERSLSYKVDGNRIVRMPFFWRDVDITWSKHGPSGLGGSDTTKISLEYTDSGQVVSVRFSSHLFSLYPFREGPLVIKRNGQGEILRFDYLGKPYVLDKALFDYYD